MGSTRFAKLTFLAGIAEPAVIFLNFLTIRFPRVIELGAIHTLAKYMYRQSLPRFAEGHHEHEPIRNRIHELDPYESYFRKSGVVIVSAMNIHPESAVVASIVNQSASSIGDFTLVDVGASGGIAYYWSAFGDRLHAIGFDPLVANMRKMAAAETRPNVRYEAAFVGCMDFDALFPPEQRQIRVDPYGRTSSVRAQELMRLDFIATHFNEGEKVILAERHVTLDDYFASVAELDFLKIDTDGSDIEVLLGADKLLRRGAFLALSSKRSSRAGRTITPIRLQTSIATCEQGGFHCTISIDTGIRAQRCRDCSSTTSPLKPSLGRHCGAMLFTSVTWPILITRPAGTIALPPSDC